MLFVRRFGVFRATEILVPKIVKSVIYQLSSTNLIVTNTDTAVRRASPLGISDFCLDLDSKFSRKVLRMIHDL